MSAITFKRDTSFRKELFTADHFAHPAKMDAQLLIWIVEHYTKPGETILDPMAGCGTTMLACISGRNAILVELEQKFVEMQKANWNKVRMMPQLGCQMGECQIIQGDARNLENILVDHAIFSPPYSNEHPSCLSEKTIREAERIHNRKFTRRSFTGGEDYSPSQQNIANLPYGDIASIITSPPYEEAMGEKHHSPRADKLAQEKSNPVTYTDKVDSIVTSPPYEGSFTHSEQDPEKRLQRLKEVAQEGVARGSKWAVTSDEALRRRLAQQDWGYGSHQENIGNLKAQSYLSAMLQVYQQCHKVLKPQGLLILVTKNFIRNKKEIRLDEDTMKLCDQAGFQFVERHYRKLPAQSFWRVIYRQKYPDAPVLDKEDILVFTKRKLGVDQHVTSIQEAGITQTPTEQPLPKRTEV